MEWRFFVLSSLAFFLLAAVRGSEGLKCYVCGTFLASSSVSPCYNLTREHLKECPRTACSKYVGLSTNVFGCETNCEERPHGAFDAYCCSDEDGCNAGHKTFLSVLLLLMTPLILGRL